MKSSVATVMPEMGLEEEPISPVSREETVTKRKAEGDDEQRAQQIHVQ